jgi:type I restriction enzyme R subunit
MTTPEASAREGVDHLLIDAGWHFCDYKPLNLRTSLGVAIREFEFVDGHRAALYLLCLDGKAIGVIEANKHGATRMGVQQKSGRYAIAQPPQPPAWVQPMPSRNQAIQVSRSIQSASR